MTTSSTSNLSKPTKKRQFPFGLVMLLFGLGVGFWGGIATTKAAIGGPDWVRKVMGITLPQPVMNTMPPAQTPPVVNQAEEAKPPVESSPTPSDTNDTNTEETNKPESQTPSRPDEPKSNLRQRPTPPAKIETKDLVGRWELEEDTKDGKTLFCYQFKEDGTGVFQVNGKKFAGFNWEENGEDIKVTYDVEGPKPGEDWVADISWSLNASRDTLTLATKKGSRDARGHFFEKGPGTFKKINEDRDRG